MLAHPGWMSYHLRNSVGGLAIFSASRNKQTTREYLDPLFCVRPGHLPRSIVGVGFIQAQRLIDQDQAWDRYGPALGAGTELEWRSQASRVLDNSRKNYDGRMLAIELVDFQPFSSPVPPSAVGLTDAGWQNIKVVDEETTRRLLDLLPASHGPHWRSKPRVTELRNRLDQLWDGTQPPTPEVLRRVQRIMKTYERPKAITRYVKQTRGTDCQLCGVPGFLKKNGTRYCEVHHLFHLSTNPPAGCLAPEYLVVLCATCHRRMHHCNVGRPERHDGGWIVSIDGVEQRFLV